MRVGYRWGLAGAVAVAGAAGVVVPALSASAAETVTTIPTGGFGSILVDESNHDVYVSGGTQGSGLAAFDQYGVLQNQLSLRAASAMALSADGATLYVAATQSIAAVDPATLAVENTWAVPHDSTSCPTQVATVGDKIYFTYGCGTEGIGVLDPATGSVTPGDGSSAAGLLAARGDKLVTTTDSTIDLYDVSTGEPVLTKSVATDPSWCLHPNDLRFGADGRILVSCQQPSHGVALSATDLSATGSFVSNEQPPVGIAGSGDGSTVAVVTTTNYAPTVWVDSADGSALRNNPLPQGETIDTGGVALSGDGTIAYAVSHLSRAYKLHVFTADALTPSLTLSGPAKVKRGKQVTLTGVFGGGSGKELTVTRTDLSGSHDLAAVTTSDGGAFTVSDKPAVGGDNVYTVAFAGDHTWAPAQATATVKVPRIATKVSLSVKGTQLTARVAHTTGSVCFSSPDLGEFGCADTNAKGVAKANMPTFEQTETVTATFEGNDKYAPAKSNKVKVKA